ncbi:MAG: glycosyltransferase family 4 protein [Gammaproteobacteria bacterium]|nr:glycosyltransferase family 4 protein [Gammaproteobacteria bacterium]
MKVLVSAFACAPNYGSDREVGWQWAVNLAKQGHDVVVLTRTTERSRIDRFIDPALSERLIFQYVDFPFVAKVTSKISKRNHLYYYFWQLLALIHAYRIDKTRDFDIVHHVTWVSLRQPSFLGLLGKPFYFGPVGGADRIPRKLRLSFGMKQKLLEAFRDIAIFTVKVDPLMHLTFASADKIIVTSKECMDALPRRYRSKAKIQLAINSEGLDARNSGESRYRSGGNLRLIYAGRLIDCKGVHLLIDAMYQLKKSGLPFVLNIVGEGLSMDRLKELVLSRDLSKEVLFLGWKSRRELYEIYRESHLMVVPALRDSGGLVILEGMSHGLPVIAFDSGGPGVTVNESVGRLIDIKNMSEEEVTRNIAQHLSDLMDDPSELDKLSKRASEWVNKFTWENIYENIYK